MSKFNLEKLSIDELKNISEKMDLSIKNNKSSLIKQISDAFSEYEEYKKEKIDKYTRMEKLGEEGKEGTAYLVKDKNGKVYAMKTFRKTKASSRIVKEYTLQKKASQYGVAPRVYDYDTVGKWILMDKMDCHLYEKIQKGVLTKNEQERIIQIFKKLDQAGVFHNDANICNYMLKDDIIYLIDYGFAKDIDKALVKKLGTDKPNYKFMTIGLILKLKDMGLDEKNYKYLLNHVSSEDVKKYNLKI
jgi:tRNA A-37 threonylcarbamoyl transferase component Bud32